MRRLLHIAPRLVLLTACALVVLVTLVSAAIRISRPFPLTPWESVIVRDAWKLTQGEPVYQLPEAGPATHMYGPMVTWLNAMVFTVSGPNLLSPRMLSAAAVLATIAMLAWFVWRHTRRRSAVLLAIALLSADALRCRAVYAEARPDALAALLGFAGLLLTMRGNWLAVPTLVLAVLTKQPAAAFALAALVGAVAAHHRRPAMVAGASLAGIAGTMLIVRVASPEVWFYMVTVPSRWPMRWPQAIDVAVAAVLALPVLLTGVAAWLARERDVEWNLHREPEASVRENVADRSPSLTRRTLERKAGQYMLAATLVLGLAGILGQVKQGGAINSLYPAFAAAAVLAALLWHRIGTLDRPVTQWLLAGLVLLHAAAIPKAAVWAFTRACHGDATYKRVIADVATLPGSVASPDDPALLIFAHRPEAASARSLDAELDAVAQQSFPVAMIDSWRAADWLIRIHATWDAHLTDEQLKDLGFTRVNQPGWSERYSLWHRDRGRSGE